MGVKWDRDADIPGNPDESIPWWCCGGAPGRCTKTIEECIAQEKTDKRQSERDKG